MVNPGSAETNPQKPARSGLGYLSLPTLCYVLVAFVLLGATAYVASSNMISEQSNKDIWQHVATLRALMDNLTDPLNPFVATEQTSRHFHPLWVGVAAMAGYLQVSVWTALTVSTYASMVLLGVAVFVFARAYFQSPWAPTVLLCTMLFGWVYQVEHTGLHSFGTLLYAAVYPATFLISLSLILWALAIKALGSTRYLLPIVLLVAFCFATHQLGAVIALIGVGCFVLLWPKADMRARFLVSAAVFLGLLISLLWPYHNPLMLVLQSGNSSWTGGPDFYSTAFMTWPFLPAVVGILGLGGRRARAMLLALVVFYGLYLFGLTGLQIAARFMMPAILVLHIGMATIILQTLTEQRHTDVRRRVIVFALSAATIAVFLSSLSRYHLRYERSLSRAPDTFASAQRLTRDLADLEPVAAYDIAAWQIVATGQRVLSVPWPEPGIDDLTERQSATRALFDPALTAEDRRALAESLGVRTIFAEDRPSKTRIALEQLSEQAVRTTSDGILWRFDLLE